MKKIFTLLLVASLTVATFAQNESHKWAIGGGISATDFSGPITKSYFDFDNYKGSGKVFVGRYLNPSFNAKLDFTFGKIWYPTITAYPEVVSDVYQLKHIYDLGLNIEYKFNNGYIFKENAVLAPYIHTGFGFNSIVDYDVNTYVPFGIGLNIRPADWLTINLQSTYKLNIDNSYDYTQHTASLVYNFGKGKKAKEDKSADLLDSDGDGIPDLIDECPFAPGTAEFFGCPDTDGDGIGDSRDNCPNEAGPIENNGCPYLDTDGDGIPDHEDACPYEKGEKRYAGCPDTDGDGIIDKYDKCPNEPGPASNNGCPLDDKKEVVTDPTTTPDTPVKPSTPTSPTTTTKPTTPTTSTSVSSGDAVVYFGIGSAVVTDSEKKKIDAVLNTLNANPNYRVKIKGYTDATGDEFKNVELSIKRAQNVWKYINEKGYDGSKVELYGFGQYFEQSPVMKENRRVEMEIVK